MDELQGVLSDLLSLKASSSQLSNALDRLRGVLTAIALETGLRDGSTITKAGFLQLQESFLHNVVARLIDFLARCLLRLQYHKYGDDYQAIFSQLGQTMQLLQGFLLLHGPSRRLFGVQCNMELLVTCLTLPDHSTPTTTAHPTSSLSESTASASPRLSSTHFDFGKSVIGSELAESDANQAAPTLAELTLETLLCALVDSPGNVKLFETCNGIVEVSRLLRGKVDAGKAAKVKCLEFLYFWLYPETERQAAAKVQALMRAPSTPATPSTPRQDRVRPSTARASSNAETPRTPTDNRLRAMLESAHDAWTPTTPSKPSRTFEKTQLALSRSAAAVAASPRKRPLHVSAGVEASDSHVDDGSPRAKRASMSQSASPASRAGSRPIRRVLPASPSGRPRSILAASSARLSSSANYTPPIMPREEPSNERKLSQTGFAPPHDISGENCFKAPPRLLWSPSKSEYPSRSPALDRPTSRYSPALERQRSRDSPALSRQRSRDSDLDVRERASDSPASGRTTSNDAKDAIRRRLSRSLHASAVGGVTGQPYRNLTGLPGVSGQTKGLFASHSRVATPEMDQVVETEILKVGETKTDSEIDGKGNTYERRRQILGQHLGNLDQLLHRFEVLRCR